MTPLKLLKALFSRQKMKGEKSSFLVKKKGEKKSNLKKQIFLFSIFLLIQRKKLGHLDFCTNLEKKTSFYRLFKHFQHLKVGNLTFSSLKFENLFLQESQLVKSLTEQQKGQKRQKVRIQVKSHTTKTKTFVLHPPVLMKTILLENPTRFQTYKKVKTNCLKVSEKKERLLRLVNSSNLLKKNWKHRLLIFRAYLKKKKRYKCLSSFLKKNRRSLTSLLRIYKKNLLKFKRKKQKKKKVFSRLARKRNRKKKWRRRGVFKRFRLRYRYRHKFYILKHFEVNYKTGELLYLGYTHSPSLNFRIPFWLNLRRLVTLFSS